MAKIYNISLLPALREQVAFYHDKNDELATHVEESYGQFLSFVDDQSEALAGQDAYDSLQRVYQLAFDRKEALLGVLTEEREDVEFWQKKLRELNEGTDHDVWQDIATELIEDGDYRADTKEFTTWLNMQSAELQQELTELIEDWRACVEEGSIDELATLLETLAEDKESEGKELDPFDGLEGVNEQADDWNDEAEFSADADGATQTQDDEEDRHPELVSGSSCCSSARDDDALNADDLNEAKAAGGCCGRQTPCCRSKE